MGLYDDVPDDRISANHLDELAASEDPADRTRASNLIAHLGSTIQDEVTRTLRGGSSSASFLLPKTRWQEQFTASMLEGEEDRKRAMANVAKALSDGSQHRHEAETAAIHTARLLDALVSLSQAQQAQLGSLQNLLQAMVEQTAALTELTSSGAIQDDKRWHKAWPAQKAEVLLAAIAAVAAIAAIWAAFAAARPPVVRVPPPVVNIELPTTTSTPPVVAPDVQAPPAVSPSAPSSPPG